MSLTLTLERGGGEVSGSGTNIELDGTIAGGAIESVEMYGDTEQQTYSGKNLVNAPETFTFNRNYLNFQQFSAGTYYVSCGNVTKGGANDPQIGDSSSHIAMTSNMLNQILDFTGTALTVYSNGWSWGDSSVNSTVEKLIITTSPISSLDDYEPYVGGTASPNPDYPQEVQTVTGEQTITISDGQGQSQSYSVNLGDIELCKIGDYQDYFYKSGEDWYVHKETNKINLDGSTEGTWWYESESGHERFIVSYADIATQSPYAANTPKIQYSNYFEGSNGYHTYTGDMNNIMSGHHNNHQIIIRATQFTSLAAFTNWLGTNKPSMYYVKATPTDTQITNSALIAQLEALNEATTYDGTTVITVNSENLAGSLEVTVSTNIAKTYTEVEIGSPFTITDVEGKSSNTTLDGNVYVDWAYNKKQYSFDLFNLTPQDYADIRAFYDYQFNNSAFPTITVPELNIDKLPVYMEISSRNIINQCLLTDKLTIKFRETVQP